MSTIADLGLPQIHTSTLPSAPPQETDAVAPEAPPPARDVSAEGAPPRGGMGEIWAARHPGRADAPGQQTFGARKALGGISHAVKAGVANMVHSGELSEDQAEAVKQAAGTLHHELQEARQSISPGDVSTAEGAHDQISAALESFYAAVDGILGVDEDNEIAASETADDAPEIVLTDAEESSDSAEIVASDETADAAVTDAVLSDAFVEETPVTPYDAMKRTVNQSLADFMASLREPVDRSTSNPFAGFYEAVGTVTDPDLTSVSNTVTTA